jgi:hypothetical protein
MINLAPGKGLGRIDRPFLAVALGYARSRSTLSPSGGILSMLPASSLEGSAPDDLVSSEPMPQLAGMITFSVPGSDHVFAIIGSLTWDLTSRSVVDVTGLLPDDVVGILPPANIVSEEPT